MAHTRASQGSADALDEALAAALAQALCAHPQGGLKLTKRERLKRHRDAIVALRAKRWSWEQIAATLANAGLDINPRTLRTEMTTPKRSRQKPALRSPGQTPATGAVPGRGTTTKRPRQPASASTLGADARVPGQRDHKLSDHRPTESGFFSINLEDN